MGSYILYLQVCLFVCLLEEIKFDELMCIYIHTYTQVQTNFDKLIGSDIISQTFGSESPPREEHTLQPCPPFLVSLKMKK